jgi:hypothetical protein
MSYRKLLSHFLLLCVQAGQQCVWPSSRCVRSQGKHFCDKGVKFPSPHCSSGDVFQQPNLAFALGMNSRAFASCIHLSTTLAILTQAK